MAARSALRYVHLPRLVPYSIGLELQQTLVARRVAALQRATPAQPAPDEDVLLLLEHRPVYTAGRRETDEATLGAEGARLRAFGADYVPTQRGGQTTYHGPGQLVGYPIVDLNAQNIRTRAFVDRIQSFLRTLVDDLGVTTIESEHTGLFISPTSKIASIGLQLQHRVTMHGFALNVDDQVKPWFNHIVACGLADVRATTLESERSAHDLKPRLTVRDVIDLAVPKFGEVMERPMVELEKDGPVWDIVAEAMRRIDEDIDRRESGEIS